MCLHWFLCELFLFFLVLVLVVSFREDVNELEEAL